jgi:tetratricopeptide (TPR) repeat protein
MLAFHTAAQPADSSEALKNEIGILFQKGDLMQANRIINQQNTLDPSYSLEMLNSILEIAKRRFDNELLAYTYLSLGNFWWFRSNQVKAYENFYAAERISKQHGYPQTGALAMMNRSHIEADAAIRMEILREAIQLFGQLGDSLNLAKAHLNLGQAFSLHVFDDGLSTSDPSEITQPDIPVSAYRDSAFFHYAAAEEINAHLNHPEISASVHLHMAGWNKFENNLDEAASNYQRAIDHFLNAGQQKGNIYCRLQLASIYRQKEEFDDALVLLKENIALSNHYHFQDYLVESYYEMVRLYDLLKMPDSALAYHKKYAASLSELNEAVSRDKIHALSLEYTMLEHESEIALLNNKRQRDNLIIALLVIATLLAIITAYTISERKRRKVELLEMQHEETKRLNKLQASLAEADKAKQLLLNDLLEEKVKLRSERIVMIANQMNKLDGLLKSLDDDVKSVLKNPDSKTLVDKINAIKLSLSQSMHEQTTLKELSILANEGNQDFIFHVEQSYRGVTKDDTKLLSFLIMNMDSKEIAGHFNISVESVHKKRYRLRQKLALPSGTTFAEFYRNTLADIGYSHG